MLDVIGPLILDVIRAGVRVFMNERGYLHPRTISIDSEICSIGSANIDIRAQRGACQPAPRERAGGAFEHDLADRALAPLSDHRRARLYGRNGRKAA